MDDFVGKFFHLRKRNLKKGPHPQNYFKNISQNFVKNSSCASLTILWLPFSLVYFPTCSLSLSKDTLLCCFSCFGDIRVQGLGLETLNPFDTFFKQSLLTHHSLLHYKCFCLLFINNLNKCCVQLCVQVVICWRELILAKNL